MVTRVSAPVSGASDKGPYLSHGSTEVSLVYRTLYAHRHFRDNNIEVPPGAPRVTLQTFDLSFTHQISPRNSLALSIPWVWGRFDRGFAAGGPDGRSVSRTSGIGDIAVTWRRWLLDPARHPEKNYRLALGIKFPTGDNSARNERPVNVGTPAKPVVVVRSTNADAAIQPGDGGYGILFGVDGFRRIGRNTLYGELSYLANPRGHNDTNNQDFGAGPYVPNPVTTVPDYYLGRLGVAFPRAFGRRNLTFSLGLRIEGQPIRDLIGGSEGFRRPGYSLSIEPGLAYTRGNETWNLSIPRTFRRFRGKSVDEQDVGRINSVSAAFTDYSVLVGYSRKF